MQLSAVETWAFGAVAVSAIVLVLVERRYPYDPGQAVLRPGFFTDFVWYNAVQNTALGVVIGRLVAGLDGATGASRLALVSSWPVFVQVALFVGTHDLYIYGMHRLQHRVPFLWRFHEAHHSVRQVDWLSGVRSHPIEILVNQTVEFLPIVLLGAAPAVAPIKGAISAIWGMFIHANLDVRLGVLQRVLNGPEMHRWHHATDPEAQGRNFATKLAVWDWLFGTAFLPDPMRRKPGAYGLVSEGFPDGYFAQVVRAFRPGPAAPRPAPERGL